MGSLSSLPRYAVVVVGLTVILLAIAACGGGGEAADEWEFQKVTPSDRVYTIDDLFAVGFKKSKHYDVEGLPEATDAWLGFWGLDPYNRTDYELRFYASHEDAVEYGAALAEEGTGEGMKASKNSQTWQEGAKHRWFAGGVTDGSSPASRQDPRPRYPDYTVFGNIVMLAEGLNSEQSLEKCASLARALEAAGGE